MNKITLTRLQQLKQQGEKIAALTAYDASFARLVDQAGVEVVLVGDSLGNVIQGHSSTIPVTVDTIAYHTQCVRRGLQQALLIADMPFMSYAHLPQALDNAAQLMRAGAEMVKVEGGQHLCETIQQLQRQGVPVCGHLGLTPQSVNVLGGYRQQGKTESQAQQIFEDALRLVDAGIQLLVLECVPATLAAKITQAIPIPVIGIGAGDACDGQILVLYDMLGITPEPVPSFVKNFLHKDNGSVENALKAYVAHVKQ
jgi:3-methyl-2-oxobutanoate hydroxymethyltransferase